MLLDKLKKIEALIQGASTPGEKQAASLAKQRVLEKMEESQAKRTIQYKVSAESPWEKHLFCALCQKYGFKPYRYYRQKYTTSNVDVPKAFMEEVLWPEYLKYSGMLRELVDEITKDLIDQIHRVEEDEVVVSGELEAFS